MSNAKPATRKPAKGKKKAAPKAKKTAKKAMPKPGTSKQAAELRRKHFAEAYIANGGNATEAAKIAGYSEKTAHVKGAQLLKEVKVQEAISSRAEATAKNYEITTDVVIKSISQELHFDPAKLYTEDGKLKQITELDEDTRMALTAIEFEQFGSPEAPVFVRKLKWASKNNAREQAMKHLGMFERDNKQKGMGLLADLPREVQKQIVEKLQQSNGKP